MIPLKYVITSEYLASLDREVVQLSILFWIYVSDSPGSIVRAIPFLSQEWRIVLAVKVCLWANCRDRMLHFWNDRAYPLISCKCLRAILLILELTECWGVLGWWRRILAYEFMPILPHESFLVDFSELWTSKSRLLSHVWVPKILLTGVNRRSSQHVLHRSCVRRHLGGYWIWKLVVTLKLGLRNFLNEMRLLSVVNVLSRNISSDFVYLNLHLLVYNGEAVRVNRPFAEELPLDSWFRIYWLKLQSIVNWFAIITCCDVLLKSGWLGTTLMVLNFISLWNQLDTVHRLVLLISFPQRRLFF